MGKRHKCLTVDDFLWNKNVQANKEKTIKSLEIEVLLFDFVDNLFDASGVITRKMIIDLCGNDEPKKRS